MLYHARSSTSIISLGMRIIVVVLSLCVVNMGAHSNEILDRALSDYNKIVSDEIDFQKQQLELSLRLIKFHQSLLDREIDKMEKPSFVIQVALTGELASKIVKLLIRKDVDRKVFAEALINLRDLNDEIRKGKKIEEATENWLKEIEYLKEKTKEQNDRRNDLDRRVDAAIESGLPKAIAQLQLEAESRPTVTNVSPIGDVGTKFHITTSWKPFAHPDGKPGYRLDLGDHPSVRALTLFCRGADSIGMRVEPIRPGTSFQGFYLGEGGDNYPLRMQADGSVVQSDYAKFANMMWNWEANILPKQGNFTDRALIHVPNQDGTDLLLAYNMFGLTRSREALRQQCAGTLSLKNNPATSDSGAKKSVEHGKIEPTRLPNDGILLSAFMSNDKAALESTLRAILPGWVRCQYQNTGAILCTHEVRMPNTFYISITQDDKLTMQASLYLDKNSIKNNHAVAQAAIDTVRAMGIKYDSVNNCLGDRKFVLNAFFTDEKFGGSKKDGKLKISCYGSHDGYLQYNMSFEAVVDKTF
jgi:hypothetical protein